MSTEFEALKERKEDLQQQLAECEAALGDYEPYWDALRYVDCRLDFKGWLSEQASGQLAAIADIVRDAQEAKR